MAKNNFTNTQKATLNNLPISVISTSTGSTRRKVQHNVYGMDGAITEDTGRNLITYGLTVICTGLEWETDRDDLEKVLDTSEAIFCNHPDFGYIRVQVLSYSIEESKLQKGLATFDIQLLESLEEFTIVTLDSKLSLLGKIKEAYNKYKSVMSTIAKVKGKILSIVTQARGIINEALNLPNTIIGVITDVSFFGALTDQFEYLTIPQLLFIQDIDFNPDEYYSKGALETLPDTYIPIAGYKVLIPKTPEEIAFGNIIKAVAFTKTLEVLLTDEPFETIDDSLLVHQKLNRNYYKILEGLDPELQTTFTEMYSEYLDAYDVNSPNLKSIYYFNCKKALLPDLFNENPKLDFDELFNVQHLTLDDLFIAEDKFDTDGVQIRYLN